METLPCAGMRVHEADYCHHAPCECPIPGCDQEISVKLERSMAFRVLLHEGDLGRVFLLVPTGEDDGPSARSLARAALRRPATSGQPCAPAHHGGPRRRGSWPRRPVPDVALRPRAVHAPLGGAQPPPDRGRLHLCTRLLLGLLRQRHRPREGQGDSGDTAMVCWRVLINTGTVMPSTMIF